MKPILSFFILIFSTIFSFANVLGDFQTFIPNTDGMFFITVDSAQTLKQGTFVGNGYFSYAKDHMLMNDNLLDQNRINHKDRFLSLDGTFGYSVRDDLQLYIGFTNLLEQSADPGQTQTLNITKGVHSYRPGLKWKFVSEPDRQMALLASIDRFNVIDDPYVGGDAPPAYNLGYAWSGRFSGLAAHGFNVTYRIRKPGTVTLNSTFYPLKDQLTFSYGYSYPSTPKLRWIFETIGCYPIDKGNNKSATNISCLEVLGASRYRLNKTWAFAGGLTVEPGIQTMAPAYRAFAGINYYIYPQVIEDKIEKEALTPTSEIPKPDRIITLQGPNFIFDSTSLVPQSEIILEKAIQTMREIQIKDIIVAGHTDSIGTEDYNQVLSEKRAETIANVLVEKLELLPEQVRTVGYGFKKPLVPNSDENSRLQNRRVELLIYVK